MAGKNRNASQTTNQTANAEPLSRWSPRCSSLTNSLKDSAFSAIQTGRSFEKLSYLNNTKVHGPKKDPQQPNLSKFGLVLCWFSQLSMVAADSSAETFVWRQTTSLLSRWGRSSPTKEALRRYEKKTKPSVNEHHGSATNLIVMRCKLLCAPAPHNAVLYQPCDPCCDIVPKDPPPKVSGVHTLKLVSPDPHQSHSFHTPLHVCNEEITV